MKLKTILLQEVFRAIVGGYLAFVFFGLWYRSGALNLSFLYILTGIVTLLIFLGFALTRIRTGRKLMAGTKKAWVIIGGIMVGLLGIFIAVAARLGQSSIWFEEGAWRVALGLLLIALSSWIGFRASRRKEG